MKVSTLLLGGLIATASFQASATDDYNRTISTVGATAGQAYVEFKEGLSYPCKFGIVYLPDSNTGPGKSMLAVLLSAQARSATIVVINYSADAGNQCTASNVRSN
ncbi:MAG: hypothetical protein ACTHOL_17670 [Luteibacter jiangsuensis]